MSRKSRVQLSLIAVAVTAWAFAARARDPAGWDLDEDRSGSTGGTVVIHYGQPQDPYRMDATAAETGDDPVAGSGSGEPQVDEPIQQDAAPWIEKFLTEP